MAVLAHCAARQLSVSIPNQQASPAPALGLGPARPVSGQPAAASSAAAAKPVLGAKRNHEDVEMGERKEWGPNKRHHGGGRRGHTSGVHTGATAFRSFVRADAASKGYVKRAYQSNAVIVESKNGNDAQGAALSVAFDYNAGGDYLEAKIMGGGPASGVNVGVTFTRLSDETCWFMKVFKYVKFTKFQINVTRMPQTVMQNTMVTLDQKDAPTIMQNGYASNMMDPGYICLRPWAGEPQVASFADGTLSSLLWEDHMRHREKVVFPASSERGAQQVKKMCIQPISQIVVAEEGNDSGDLQYEYKPTPPIDVAHIRTNKATLNSYGLLYFWYYPASSGAIDDAFKLSFTFEIELAFFGLNIPTSAAPTLPAGAYWDDDPAVQYVENAVVVERPIPEEPPAIKWKLYNKRSKADPAKMQEDIDYQLVQKPDLKRQ